MPRRGENIYKRKDGRWEGRFIKEYGADGKARYAYTYGKSYTEVKGKMVEMQGAQLSGLNAQTQKTGLYGDILLRWLSSTQLNVKESTYARYYHLVMSHIKDSLGKYNVCKISPALIESYIDALRHHGRLDGKGGLSPKTVSDILAIIKNTLDYARYHGYTVPCDLARVFVKKKEEQLRVLSNTERILLEAELLENMDTFKFGILLSLYTGIRIGELCALKWKCFHFDDGILEIRETMQRIQDVNSAGETRTKIVITEPKSKCSVRKIPLPDCMIDLALLFKGDPESFVLVGKRGKMVEPRTVQNYFKRYVAASGIAPVNFHALRHTFATRCVELGFEIKSLSEILGHANVNITLNRYVHSSIELKRNNMNKLTFSVSA